MFPRHLGECLLHWMESALEVKKVKVMAVRSRCHLSPFYTDEGIEASALLVFTSRTESICAVACVQVSP